MTSAGGYFFSYESVEREQVVEILVSTALEYRMGAPGLLLYEKGDEGGHAYTAGVFIGFANKQNARSIRLG